METETPIVLSAADLKMLYLAAKSVTIKVKGREQATTGERALAKLCEDIIARIIKPEEK